MENTFAYNNFPKKEQFLSNCVINEKIGEFYKREYALGTLCSSQNAALPFLLHSLVNTGGYGSK